MRILVTGGSGFIGSHLVQRLAEQGRDVRILDCLDPQIHKDGKYEPPRNVKFIKGSVTSVADWTKALDDVDAVYHLAAAVGISQSMHKPAHFLETNAVGTANMYEAVLQNAGIRKRLKRIIIPSSKTIYGEGTYKCKNCGIVYPQLREREQLEKKDWEMRCPRCGEHADPLGTKEDKPVNPISVYALSKYGAENLALNFSFAMGISTLVFRGFSVYGPGQSLSNPYSGVCSIFLSRIKNGQPPIIFEDGGQLRDYIYVDDVTMFLIKVLDSKAEGVFNLGTGKPTSVKEIADILLEETDSSTLPKITEEFRIGDNRHDFADTTKAEKELGFNPRHGIRTGLKALVEWGEKSEADDMFDESERVRKRYFN
jgi:dTDP-L-rhamnose 4-epimerase